MTQFPHITKIDGIERLPAGGIPGFCCETRDCPGCVRAYRRGLALLGETYGKSVPVAPRKPRKPTLASVAKQASKAAIPVARYEVKLDGTITAVVGQPEQQQGNEVDEWIAKHACAPERH